MSPSEDQREHPVQKLFELLRGFRYPPDVTPTDELVAGPEFFPGGCGLWNAERGKPWPTLDAGVVVLAHNLDSVDSYRRHVREGGRRSGPTWRNLERLLPAAGVDLGRCFLTNFFMGCGPDQEGAFPGAKHPWFVDDCLEFLRATIRLLRPAALVVLGGHTRRHLARLAPELAPWRDVATFAELDAKGLAVISAVTVSGAPPFGAVNVVHPSGATRGMNQKARRFGGAGWFAAEVAAVRVAVGTG